MLCVGALKHIAGDHLAASLSAMNHAVTYLPCVSDHQVEFAVKCQQKAVAMGTACAFGASIADVGLSALQLPAVVQRTLIGLDLLDTKPPTPGLTLA